MIIDGVTAVIAYDPNINQFRGTFLSLNGGADFYADDITGLKREGALSLKVFREACAEDGVEPLRSYSGRFVVRTDPESTLPPSNSPQRRVRASTSLSLKPCSTRLAERARSPG
jgi:predicted HicB family RNase H-like nuclease